MTKKPSTTTGTSKRPLRKPIAAAVAAACSISSVVLIAPPALAQETLEEVVVTATRRTESVQDVPMAITVLGQEQLTDMNITDMEDYMQVLSNTSYISCPTRVISRSGQAAVTSISGVYPVVVKVASVPTPVWRFTWMNNRSRQ